MQILNSPRIKNARKILFIALCVNLIVVSAYSYILIKIGQKNRHIAELSRTVETLVNQKANLKLAEETVSETALLREQIDRYFIPEDGVVQFLNSLQSLGADNNLELKIISVAIDQATLSPDIFESVNVNVEIFGTWSNVRRFTALIELMPLKIYLNRIDLEKVTDETSSGGSKNDSAPFYQWRGVLDLRVFKLK